VTFFGRIDDVLQNYVVHTTIISLLDNDCQDNYPEHMVKPTDRTATLDPELLRPSGALLAAQIAIGAAIEHGAVEVTGRDSTTLDLLVRLALAPDSRLRAVEICRQLQLSPSHVSRRIDRAEASGLVKRVDDPDDRRAKLVLITDRGRDVVADFAPRLHHVLDCTIHQILQPDEVETLVRYLGRIEFAARASTSDQS